MAKSKIKKGDTVIVISGNDAHHEDINERCGQVLDIDRKNNRVVVEGINVRQVTKKRSMQDTSGGFDSRECSIHLSNVMLKERWDARRAKRG